jgi:Tfp pilus assembly protein PilV
MVQRHGCAGTSLIEAMIAIGLLAGAVVLMASLAALAVRTNARARERTLATLLAVQKIESLAAVSNPAQSSLDTLEADAPGFVDFVDAAGQATARPDGAVFVRRWLVSPVEGSSGLLRLTVEAAPCRRRPPGICGDPDTRVRLTTVRRGSAR